MYAQQSFSAIGQGTVSINASAGKPGEATDMYVRIQTDYAANCTASITLLMSMSQAETLRYELDCAIREFIEYREAVNV